MQNTALRRTGQAFSASSTPEVNYKFDTTQDGTFRMCIRNIGNV
jgi:hypothetical protein